MSNLLGFATARRQSRGELLAGWLAGGEARVYDGTRATTADTAIGAQVRLVTFDLADPVGTMTGGVLTASAIAPAMVANSGTAAWVRMVDSAGATIFDADVGASGSGAFLELDNVTLNQGGYCSVVSFTFTER